MSLSELRRRLLSLFRKDDLVRDLDDEMQLHIDLRARRLREQGLSPADARSTARKSFGNRTTIQEASSELWRWPSVDHLLRDLRYSFRALRKTPVFTAVALLTLALGLGMNTAIFSVVNGIMLRSLPYREPGRLVSLWETLNGDRSAVAPANLADYRSSSAFTEISAYDLNPMDLTGGETPERLPVETVTHNYFRTLGVDPILGRTFSPEEDRAGGPNVVIISHRFWQSRFGLDASVLGRTLTLNGETYSIIGVLPDGFESPAQLRLPDKIDLYVPIAFSPDLLANRADHEVRALARLRPGTTIQSAQAELDRATDAIRRAWPGQTKGLRAVIAPLQRDLVSSARDGLLAILGASGLIVLITCVNVANLLLARAVTRRHETSVRLALGAARFTIVRQLLVESMLVAVGGCIAGLALAQLLMRLLVAFAPPAIPRLYAVAMDWRVFAAATAIATVTGIVFGLAPAWQASRTKPVESMSAGSRNAGGLFHARWRTALTIVEVALSLILLVGAGLMLKSFVRLVSVDLGLRSERVIALSTNLSPARYRTQEQRLQFFEQLESRIRTLPGVLSVGFANRMPPRPGGWSSGFQLESSDRSSGSDFQAVSPGYFETLGMTRLAGRLFTPGDRVGAIPVAVVNQAFARKFLPQRDPLGARLRRGANAPWITIVGVVSDIRRGGKAAKIEPQVYLAAGQTNLYPIRLGDTAVFTAGDPRQLIHAIQRQVWAIDKDQTVTSVMTLEEIISASVAEKRFQMLLLAIFAAIAVTLAVIGIYGVLAYLVGQRTSEFGIRIALGAAPGDIGRMVLRQAAVVVAAGLAAGFTGALALTKYLETLLFEVKSHDWWTYVGAVVLLAAVALSASLIPARRGARIDPLRALRYE